MVTEADCGMIPKDQKLFYSRTAHLQPTTLTFWAVFMLWFWLGHFRTSRVLSEH